MKTNNRYVSLGITIVALAVPVSVLAWEEHGEDEGVTVHTRPVEGSDVPAVRATGVIDAETETVWEYITGPEVRVKGLRQKVVLGKCNSSCEYIYMRLGHPLITDRHYVVKVDTHTEPRGEAIQYTRKWAHTDARALLDNDAMTVSKIRGSWKLEPIDGGSKTRLIYTNHIDMGGNLTGYFFRRGFISKAYELIQELREGATEARADRRDEIEPIARRLTSPSSHAR